MVTQSVTGCITTQSVGTINDQWRAIKAIPAAEREQDPVTDTTSLPPLYPK
ncbi:MULTISPECIES: hypothetical protein [Pseudomonas fluorescens group]|uniref:hypothetical protein n=1 Tax=Pseudomonas fluorescens group TaxID=136843 RepID=UPI000AAF61DA|nr:MULTISPECIES: hypothetical protein [Pseudomonas fluorescens group]